MFISDFLFSYYNWLVGLLHIKNLIPRSHDNAYYNAVDLNHIFYEDHVLEEWVKENEPLTLAKNHLIWLDEDIHHSKLHEVPLPGTITNSWYSTQLACDTGASASTSTHNRQIITSKWGNQQ